MYSLRKNMHIRAVAWFVVMGCLGPALTFAQLTDRTQAPNTAKAGIGKSLQDEAGAGRGDANTWGSSTFIIQRDPFRSIRRGRQLFQRKFTHLQGQGANDGDGSGDLNLNGALGAGLSEKCSRMKLLATSGPSASRRSRRPIRPAVL